MARLEMSRDNRTKEYELGDNTLLGRKSDCTICVPSPKASREHCRIVKKGDKYYLEDLGASNGTLLNGKKIAREQLKHKDEITIGGVTFHFLEESNDPLVGQRLGKYEILEKVGVGGMGIVYRARQTSLGRIVALKVMNKKLAAQESFIQSFEREAKIAARLQHQNIIGIHDFGYEDGWYYFSMEFVEGENLLDLTLRQGELSAEECLPYAIQVAEALAHAHSHGVLHKDIKPQNIMITHDNTVKLADMGLASLMQQEKDPSAGDQPIMATPQYVPPEIIRRQDADQRSDIYSFAATLFHVMTGRVPYEAGDIRELLKMHLHAPVPDPRDVNPKVPEPLALFIMKGLSKDPAERQQSAEECVNELKAIRLRPRTRSQVVAPAPEERPAAGQGNQKRPTASPSLDRTLKTGNVTEDGVEPVLEESSGFQLLLEKVKAIGPVKLGLAAAAIIVLVIGGLSLGLYYLREDRAAHAAALWAQTEAHYADQQLSEDDERAIQLALAQIRDKYHDVPFKGDPDKTYGEMAAKREEFLNMPRALRFLASIKMKFAARKIKKDAAVTALRNYLKTGPEIAPEHRNEISKYIVKLGGDADVRPQWERDCTSRMDNGDLIGALAAAKGGWEKAEEGEEKSRAWDLMREVEDKMTTAAAAEVTKARDLPSRGEFVQAMHAFPETRMMFGGKPDSPAQKALIFIGTDIVRPMTAAIARGWQGIAEAMHVGDFPAATAAAAQANVKLKGHLRADCGARLAQIAAACNAFYARVAAVAKTQTAKDRDHVRVTVDGAERNVAVEGRDGQLFAIGKKNQQAIKLEAINPEDLSGTIIKPSSLSKFPREALGAYVYFRARGRNDLADKYLMHARPDRNLRPAIADIESYQIGDVPLFSLKNDNDWKKTDKAPYTIYDHQVIFKEPGRYEVPGLSLPMAQLRVNLKAEAGIAMDLAANDEKYLRFEFTESGVKFSGKVGETLLAPQTVPATGAVRLQFSDSGLTVTDGGARTLMEVAVEGLDTWFSAAAFTVTRPGARLLGFDAAIFFPQLTAGGAR
ncbi:MAG: protein kinase [Planctomycetes bacterium]|nr:protein kinase [Planctomycetota bacterium]